MPRKIIAMSAENVLSSNANLHQFLMELEQFLLCNYQPSFKLSKKQLEGFSSISFDMQHLGDSLEKSCLELMRCKSRLRDLRLDLKTLEPLHPDAAPLRQSLDELMDTLEIPKEYFWLETHFPGDAFREGMRRFYDREGYLFCQVKSVMASINKSIDEPRFHFKSVGFMEGFLQTLGHFVKLTQYGFDETFWASFDHKSIFVGGKRFLQQAYFETLLKSEDLPSPLSWSMEPKCFDYKSAHEVIVTQLLPILEHLCIQYDKLQLDRLDGPPNIEFMSSFPDIRDNTLEDIPVQARKLQRMLPSEAEVTIYL